MLTEEEKKKIREEEIFRKEIQEELKTGNNRNFVLKFLNSQIGLLVLGFLFTSVIGTILSEQIQRQSYERQIKLEDDRQNTTWRRDKKFEILKRQLDEGQSSLEEISDVINTRFYRLQLVSNNIVAGDLANAEKNWKEYFETVDTWNIKLTIYQNKITRLVSEEEGKKFNNYETDKGVLENPESIHGMFFVCHKKVFEALKILRSGQRLPPDKEQLMLDNLSRLDIESDYFVDRISSSFLKKAAQIDSL
jgi:hypothetical protein